VFRVSDFGAHVLLPNGMPALVHISQWAHHRVKDIHEVAAEGMEVDVVCKARARACVLCVFVLCVRGVCVRACVYVCVCACVCARARA
jgi:hypothetical protein